MKLSSFKIGIEFILKHQFSKDVSSLYKEHGYTAIFIKKCKAKSARSIILLMLSTFFLSISLPVLSLLALIASTFYILEVGKILGSPLDISTQSHFFSAITEKKDEITYSFYTEHPFLDPQHYITLEEALKAVPDGIAREGYLYANSQIVNAIKLFSLNEDSKSCFDVYYNDIIKLKLSKVI